MTKTDFEKAMKKISEEDYKIALDELDASDHQHNLAIKKNSVDRREMKIKKEFLSEAQPNLTI